MYVCILLVSPIQKAGGLSGNEDSDCSDKMDRKTPQNHMTTDPNKLWEHAEVAVKFDSRIGQLTDSLRYNFSHY